MASFGMLQVKSINMLRSYLSYTKEIYKNQIIVKNRASKTTKKYKIFLPLKKY